MDLITLLAVLLIVVGLALVLAGYFLPNVSPDAARAGWGLLALGVIIVLVVFLVDELGDASIKDDNSALENRSSWGATFGPLGFIWSYLHERRVLRRPVRMHPRS